MTPPNLRVPRLVAEDAIANAPAHVLGDVAGGPGPKAATTVRFGFTHGAFLALFDAPAEPPLLVARTPGGEVFRDECVEVFLASPGTPSLYQEIVVNPAGALYGARVRNPDDSRTTWQLAPGEGLTGVTATVWGEPGRPSSLGLAEVALPGADPLGVPARRSGAGRRGRAPRQRDADRAGPDDPVPRPLADVPRRPARLPRPEPVRAPEVRASPGTLRRASAGGSA